LLSVGLAGEVKRFLQADSAARGAAVAASARARTGRRLARPLVFLAGNLAEGLRGPGLPRARDRDRVARAGDEIPFDEAFPGAPVTAAQVAKVRKTTPATHPAPPPGARY
jgi:hypothetical protein